ncbi:glycosyltransferase family 4 protein [Psychromonas sp. L1A2]|uniref:glycosyltransferase family 4 protein n=1 Tax=Psychromonas sp. L1A2 TaxID=2686356 RepID=UPI0013567408|nr:glycosyltransferase family 4 protein [Psychromonas sp. L1A2]
MNSIVNVVHYWAGSPILRNSKWWRTLKLIEKCSEFGWNNWLVLSKPPADATLVNPFLEAGCKIIYQPRSKGNFDFSSMYRNFKFLRSMNCTIFHCNNDHTSPIIAAKLARVPISLWSKLAMSSYYELGTEPTGLHKLMPSLRATTFLADKVLAISHAVKYELAKQVGFDHKIAVVDAPVPVDKYISAKAMNIREELNFLADDIVITAVGHSVEVKGWDIAIQAFALVAKQVPRAKLLLVGKHTSVSFHKKLCALVNNNGLDNRVTFAGSRSDIENILKASDLFIFPSRSEGVGAALIEARAAGLACVATNAGGIPEVIEDGVNGFLFERENITELAEKIIIILSDTKLKADFIEAGHLGLDKYTIDTYVNNVFSHYQSLLGLIDNRGS